MTNKKNEKKRDTGEKPHLKKKNAGSHPSHGLTCGADRVCRVVASVICG